MSNVIPLRKPGHLNQPTIREQYFPTRATLELREETTLEDTHEHIKTFNTYPAIVHRVHMSLPEHEIIRPAPTIEQVAGMTSDIRRACLGKTVLELTILISEEINDPRFIDPLKTSRRYYEDCVRKFREEGVPLYRDAPGNGSAFLRSATEAMASPGSRALAAEGLMNVILPRNT